MNLRTFAPMNSPHIYLAPLHGYTDYAYRNAHASVFHGIDSAIAPFISLVAGTKVKPSRLRDMLPTHNTLLHTEPQFLGNSSQNFIVLANSLAELNYSTINWNLGCPVKAIAHKKRGAGILPFPDLIDKFLNETIGKTPLRLSVKMRLGYHIPEESVKVIEVLNQYPLDYVVIHPRLGIQMYEGNVSLSGFESCIRQLKHPFIYNGDIFTKEDFFRIQERLPEVKKIMIGRGLMANPFLADQIKGKIFQEEEYQEKFEAFHLALVKNLIESRSHPNHALTRLKQYWKDFDYPFIPKNFEYIKGMQNLEEYFKFFPQLKDNLFRGI